MPTYYDNEFDKFVLEEPSKSIFKILNVNFGKYGITGDNLLFPVTIEVENKQIIGIYIHYTGEAHLLEPLCDLPFLEWLNLKLYDYEKNKLFLPNSLDKLKSLKSLNLSTNRMIKIPNIVYKLKWLENLKPIGYKLMGFFIDKPIFLIYYYQLLFNKINIRGGYYER